MARLPWFALLGLGLATPAFAGEDPFDLFDMRRDEEPEEDAGCAGDAPVWPCLTRADREPDPAPARLGETLARERLWDLGAGDVTHASAGARARGAWLEADGGIALAGATSLEHRWTVDGFPIDSLANGAADTRIPLAFLESIEVTTGGAPASARASTGAIVDARLRGPGERGVTARAWTGVAAPARSLPAVPGQFDPMVLELDDAREVGAVATGGAPLRVGRFDRAWAFAGASLVGAGNRADRVAQRLRDEDGDGAYDRHADRTYVTEEIDRQRRGDPVAPTGALVVRVGGGDGVHDLAATLLGTYRAAARGSADGTASAAYVDRTDTTADAFVTWTARWPRTELTVTAGWHRSARHDAARTALAGDAIQVATAYVPSPADVPEDALYAAACVDSGDPAVDPFTEVLNCPVPTGYYVRDGAGQLFDIVGDRPAITAEVARRFRAAGAHRAALGVTGEDARWVVERRFTGGLLERRLAEALVFHSWFVETEGPGLDDDCLGTPCRLLDVASETYRTRYLAAWLEDAWTPARGLTLQAGLRWESMEVGDAIRFTDQLAPRIGVALDPTGRGHGRFFGGWSRLHPMLPAGVGTVVADESSLYTVSVGDMPFGAIFGYGGVPVADDLAAPVVDELVAGAEWVVADRLQVGARVRARALRHGMDVIAGTLDNPGDVAGGPRPARRDSQDLEVWFGNAVTAPVHVRVGWIGARQRGSWPGPTDPVEGTTLYESSFEGSSGNDHGPLPLDLPSRLIAEAVAGASRAGTDVTVGLRFETASGRPYGVLGGPDGEVRLLPRGAGGRLPPTSRVVLHVAARRGRFELALDLVDVFDRRALAAVDERWTTADVRPIEGGSEADLIWLRDLDGRLALPNPGRGVVTRYHPALFGRLALSATF